ncbi:MAG: hypothetical protein L3J49_08455, partial [Desulfobulbaceae bacterium]|nr:hypothetical protein [Desulfobulbaceae bacterium]
AIFILGCGCDVKNLGPAMLVYPKIAHEVMSYQAIFILGCGCDVKKSWSSHAGLSENRPRSTLIQAIFILGCGCDVKNLGPAMLVYPKIAHEVR